MNEGDLSIPEQLREAVAGDLRPVRPLGAPWKRFAFVLPVALAAMGIPYAYVSLRDTGEIGLMLGWMPVAVQVLLAFALLIFALREGIPGWRASTFAIFAICGSAFTLQILINMLIYLRSPTAGTSPSFAMWLTCFRVESLIGVPILFGIAWLVARTLPARPLLAGFLAGTGAGLAGDASWRMICPYSDASHVLMGHTGGILVLGVSGLLLGYLWTLHSDR